MKKNIIALAVASAIAAPVAMADAPTVYGQVNAAINSTSEKGMKTTDRDSRVGVKGSEDLGNGLKAVYQMEFGVKVADAMGTGATSTFSGRNAVVGLAGGFGTVLLGRHDTPMKMIQAKDLFNDATYSDMGKKAMAGGLGAGGKAGEVRADNVIAYVSPSMNGVKIIAAGISNAATAAKDSSLTNAYSVAVAYGSTKKGLYLAGAYNNYDAKTQTNGKSYTEMRLAAQYAVAGLIGNVTYQNFDDGASTDGATEGSNIQVDLGYKMGNLMPKFKYSMVDYKSTAKSDGNAYALGLDYTMSKTVKTYVEYTSSDKKLGAVTDANGNAVDMSDVAVGLLVKF